LKKYVWVISVAVVLFLAYYLIAGLDQEMSRYEIINEEVIEDTDRFPKGKEEDLKELVVDYLDLEEGLEALEEKIGEELEPEEDTEEIMRALENGDGNLENGEDFFVEYRLVRDRTRGQEMEMLEEMLDSPGVSSESKKEAEKNILEIVDVMEKELLIENLLKARGYVDALLFYRGDLATVMLKTGELSEEEVLQVSQVVAGATEVSREQVKIMVHNP